MTPAAPPITRLVRLVRLVWPATFALASLCAGCSEGACFEWTEAEGACPSQEEALTFFEEPSCHFSEIKTVDSDGTFDEGACCYAVTKWSKNEERAFICQ